MLALAAASVPAHAVTPAPTAPASAAASVTARAATADETDAAAFDRVQAMSLREKAASVIMGHIPTTDPGTLTDYMSSTHVGGFILMGANIPADEPRLRALTSALTIDADIPPLIAVDEEGGDVTRLPWDHFRAGEGLQGASDAEVEAAFAGRGALVQRAGIGVNFGVIADVTADRRSFIFDRVLGTSPNDAAAHAAAAVRGEGDQALTTLKHFPGHGAVEGNSHVMIPATAISKADWEKTDAVPFRSGIDAGAPLLMFGHLAYTAVDRAPASLSAHWHEIARSELGFDGVAITDDLGMLQASGVAAYRDPVANAVAAVAAGNDMVLSVMFTTPTSADRITDGIVAAVGDGTLPPDRLEQAAERVMRLRLQTAGDGRGMVPCPDCAPVD